MTTESWRIRQLAVFTLINAITYFDRGTLATALDTIEDAFVISNFKGGLLGGAYMAGYCIASPLFAHYVNSFDAYRMMGFGLGVWALANLATGLAPEYWSLLVARAFTGVGEASFLCIAPPFIDKFAPSHLRSQWLGLYFTAIPLGYALGFMAGGAWIGHGFLSDHWNWRAIYIAECCLMMPFVVWASFFASAPFSFDATSDQTNALQEPLVDVTAAMGQVKGDSECGRLGANLKIVLNPLFVIVNLGYAAQTFVLGGFAYYGMQYTNKYIGMDLATAGLVFGGLTVITGIAGSGAGGLVLDLANRRAVRRLRSVRDAQLDRGYAQGPTVSQVDPQGSSILVPVETVTDEDAPEPLRAALIISTMFSIVALPAAVLAFTFHSMYIFFPCLAVAQFCAFACISPINSAIMWCVPFQTRPIAVAVCTLIIHALGDAISPAAIGALLDKTNSNWSLVMQLCSAVLLFPCLLWAIAIGLATRHQASMEDPLMNSVVGSTSAFASEDERRGSRTSLMFN